MKDKYKVSEEALFVRSKIREQKLDHCLDLTPEQVETVLKLSKEYVESKKQGSDEELNNSANKFLVIELDSIDKVPRVFYKGKEITGKLRVYFDWETRHIETPTNYFPAISIVYAEHDDMGAPYVKVIGYDSLFKERRIDLSLWEKSRGCRTTHSTSQQPGKSAEKLS
jgi:hypothetical protein